MTGGYDLNGTDRNGNLSGSNCTVITLKVGDTINFDMNVSDIHPLWIKTTQNIGTGDAVTNPVASNNGSYNSTISWTPSSAGTYYYICENH